MPITHAPAPATHYPADRAFIVKFCSEVPGASPRELGRVEHLISGRQASFVSMKDLASAIARCLNGAAADRCDA